MCKIIFSGKAAHSEYVLAALERDWRLHVAHRAAATSGAAAARAGAPEAVIGGKFLPSSDSLQAVKEDSALHSPNREIRRAAMVNELGSASAYGAVDTPASVQTDKVCTLGIPGHELLHNTARDLSLRDSLTCVLDNALARRNLFCSEDSEPVNARPADAELEAGESVVYPWAV
jgi:hypothetical protein